MKNFKTMLSTLLLAVFLSLGVAAVAPTTEVYATDLSRVVDNVNNSKGGVIGSETKNKVNGLSKDAIDIAGIVVMAIVMISGIFCGIKFVGAGDNSSAKSALKGAIAIHVLALAFLASYFGFVNFSFKNFNFFK